MKKLHPGINILAVDVDTKPEDQPKEYKELMLLVDTLLANTTRMCTEQDINLTLIPSVFLHAFNKITPIIVESILNEHEDEAAQLYLNGMQTIIADSFKLKEEK